MKKILFIFGTRPEAIKLAPLIKEAERHRRIKSFVCITAQHRGMLDQVLRIFGIRPDYDLDIMEKNQDLFGIMARSLGGLKGVLKKVKPDLVVVQGDTTTAFAAGLAAYYLKIPLAHVEAGLRTYNKFSPFPEEINRHLLTTLADYHFAPTEWAKSNLIKEGVPKEKIWVTGNTVIDALLMICDKQRSQATEKRYARIVKDRWNIRIGLKSKSPKLILVTGHRRENFGTGFRNICMALKEIARRRPDVMMVYPVHLNPNVQKPVRSILGRERNIFLIEPLDYNLFVYFMQKCHFLLTDSGGVQEEAPALGKPVLLMRNTTERPEGVKAGTVKMVGTDKNKIVREALALLDRSSAYARMSRASSPYGDGKAAKKIMRIITKECKLSKR